MIGISALLLGAASAVGSEPREASIDSHGAQVSRPASIGTIAFNRFRPDPRAGRFDFPLAGSNQLFLMRGDGRRVRPLGRRPLRVISFRQSPTAKRIAAVALSDRSLFTVGLDGQNRRTVFSVRRGEGIEEALWSPDGTLLAFQVSPSYVSDLERPGLWAGHHRDN